MDKNFEPVDLFTDLADNPFSYFLEAPILLVGKGLDYNAMTIGWGALGYVWRQPAMTVYVAPARYTFEFLERSTHFTVMSFVDSAVADFMGANSGRSVDKAKTLGLTLAYTPNNTPYFLEARQIYECEIMYSQPFDETKFRNSIPAEYYAHSQSGIHTFVVGAIVGAWKRK